VGGKNTKLMNTKFQTANNRRTDKRQSKRGLRIKKKSCTPFDDEGHFVLDSFIHHAVIEEGIMVRRRKWGGRTR
jgi:hypothetical protein